MSPLDPELLRRKLQRIVENLKEIEEIRSRGWNHYRSTKSSRKLAERYFQEPIEAASDINSHVAVELGAGAPHDYRSGFFKLAEAKVIPRSLAEALAPSAGLRKRIVHEYDVLDDRKVFEGLKTAIGLFPKYVKRVRDRLRRR
jgi:uncharacterized protein YutE (UPF0331/DUF86 family)